MKEPIRPRQLPRWLHTQPALMTVALAAVNRLQRIARWRSLRGTVMVLAIAVITAAVIAVIGLVGIATVTWPWLAANAPVLSVVLGIHALLTVRRRRAHATQLATRSWLIATPMFVATRSRAHAVQVFGPVLAQILAIVMAIGILGAVGGALPGTLRSVLSWLAGGALLGGAIGARWPQRELAERTENSRYVPHAKGHVSEPSLSGLSRWPVLHAIAWHRPENARVLFIVAALSVPLGSSALLGLAIVVFWTLASYMVTLLNAVPSVGREASIWLRATPIGFARFAWALSRRALLHQAIGTVLVGATLLLLGTPALTVVRLAASWLSIVVVVSGVGLADVYRARSPTLRNLFYVGATLATEYKAHGWAMPLAVTIAAAHVRGAMKHARA